MRKNEFKNKLIIALDVDSEEKALKLVDELKDLVKIFKVGSELFTSSGPKIIDSIKRKGCGVFLDLKFHDIPNTVAKAAGAAAKLGVYMFNVHALGGYDMMKKVKEAAPTTKVLAVTILTSMDENSLKVIGINDNMEAQVLRLARLAKEAGLEGVVASPVEAALIRKNLGEDFLIVTPGVRPAWAEAGDPSTGSGSVLSLSKDDQKRITTPREAIEAGADYIVMGRPIIEAKDPAEAAKKISREIG